MSPCSMRSVCPGLHFGIDACHARNKKRASDDVIAKASRKLPFSALTPARFFLCGEGGCGSGAGGECAGNHSPPPRSAPDPEEARVVMAHLHCGPERQEFRDGEMGSQEYFAGFPRNGPVWWFAMFSVWSDCIVSASEFAESRYGGRDCSACSVHGPVAEQRPMGSIQRDGTRVAVPVRSWRPQRRVVSSGAVERWSAEG